MIERLAPPGSPAPKGHYSPAVRAGDFIFVSGQGPFDPATGQLCSGDIQHETKATLKNVQHILKGCGSGLEDVVKTSVFLADISEFSDFDKAYGEAFGPTKPARTTVSAKFSNPKMKVEIDCIAYKPK
jgi:2-iminobutanoate/2-iminopropanoate deaminase